MNGGLNSALVFDASLTGVLLFTILGLFFMFYVSRKETSAYEAELQSNLSRLLAGDQGLLTKANAQTNGMLRKTFGKLPLDSLIAQEKRDYTFNTSTVNNQWLFRVITLVIVVLWGALAALAWSLSAQIPLWRVGATALAGVLVVGLVEVVFFMDIASHYIPTPPSLIVHSALDTLKAW